MANKQQHPSKRHRSRGFERASGLLQGQIGRATEKRGFAVSRLLTQWAEIVGQETARAARLVKISYSQGGFGATLTVLTTGSQAPMLQAELPRIRDKVNAVYGFAAIARIRITQTAPSGFAEGQVVFSPPVREEKTPDPAAAAQAKDMANGIGDNSLRNALQVLGKNILSRS